MASGLPARAALGRTADTTLGATLAPSTQLLPDEAGARAEELQHVLALQRG
jgi:hypothetical protein